MVSFVAGVRGETTINVSSKGWSFVMSCGRPHQVARRVTSLFSGNGNEAGGLV